jgi:hypothetical protein
MLPKTFARSDWKTLARQRWGAALQTSDPSIIIDIPSPERRWQALNHGKTPLPPLPIVKPLETSS